MNRFWASVIALRLMKTVLAASGLAVLWLGLTKLDDAGAFAAVVESHGLVPAGAVQPLSSLFIWVEIFCGALMLWCSLGAASRASWGAAALTALCLSMTAYAVMLVIQPPPEAVPCGCVGGGVLVESWAPIVSRNAWLTTGAAVLTLCFVGFDRAKPGRGPAGQGAAGQGAAGAPIGLPSTSRLAKSSSVSGSRIS